VRFSRHRWSSQRPHSSQARQVEVSHLEPITYCQYLISLNLSRTSGTPYETCSLCASLFWQGLTFVDCQTRRRMSRALFRAALIVVAVISRLHNGCANLTMAKFINADSSPSDSSPQESQYCQPEGWFASSLLTASLINRQLAISSRVCARTLTHLSAAMTMCANCTSAVKACTKRRVEKGGRLPVPLLMSSNVG
jgi:hypothetical protein